MNTNNRISNLRNFMKTVNIDVCLLPTSDPHQCEYAPEHWAARAWFSGFDGSAGVLLVSQDHALVWTDSRYFIQARQNFEGTVIQLIEQKTAHTSEYLKWMQQNLASNLKIAIPAEMLSVENFRQIETALLLQNIQIITDLDFISPIWMDRPKMPISQIFEHDLIYCGQSRLEKLQALKIELAKTNCTHHLLACLEDIAWLLNLRAMDILYNPVFVSYLLVSNDCVCLFIDPKKINKEIEAALSKDGIQVFEYEYVVMKINSLSNSDRLHYNPEKLSYSIFQYFNTNLQKIESKNPSTILKSIKNNIEIENWQQTIIIDGLALVRFFYWLEQSFGQIKITELSASNKLLEFRKQGQNFICESFGTISAYAAHGAIVHYQASIESDSELIGNSLYLLDSGGQYLGGTTDITRTICLGQANDEEKRVYTLVLKGTINLSKLNFPEGTKGFHIDAIARQALWNNHCNFGHGTGHGVGYFLSVHEGPHSISQSAVSQLNTDLKNGMIVTIEPGFYREGKYGIRIENMVLIQETVQNEFGRFLNFETMTLCPIDTNLIDRRLLNKDEIEWLNNYHSKVYDQLSPFLEPILVAWLKIKTAPFNF